jgi:HEAT repeat protein
VPPGVARVLTRLEELRGKYRWQRYRDRDTYPRYESFLEVESAYFGEDRPPEERAERLKTLIVTSLDDLVTDEERAEALDVLAALPVELTDSDRYRLAVFLEHEPEITPFAERLVPVLSRGGSSAVLPILGGWLERNPGPKSLALYAETLAAGGEETVERAAVSDRAFTRRAAMRAAVIVAGHEGADAEAGLELLTRGAADKSPLVRREALLAIGEVRPESAAALLEKGLADESPDVRAAAVEALGDLGDPAVLPLLMRELGSDELGRRVAAVQALCASDLDDAVTPVLAALESDPSPLVRDVAAREVDRFGVKAMKGLSGIVMNPARPGEARARAIDPLTRIGRDHVVVVLTALLDDPDTKVADAAAIALASRGNRAAVTRLIDALDEGRDTVRVVAALELITGQSFPLSRTQDLPTIYRGWWKENQERSEADWFVTALTLRGYDPEEFATLGEEKPKPSVIPALIRALGDPNWYIRAGANLWLERITLESFGEADRFAREEEVREIQGRWRDWWESR